MNARSLTLALTATALMGAGCAQDVPEINRVQPNYVKKSDFLGREYYVRTAVVGTQFTSAYSFPGEMSTMTRGVFEVQESTLLFNRTYEFILGSEAYAQKADADVPLRDNKGNVVQHAVLMDFARVACDSNDDCPAAGSRCAGTAGNAYAGEELHLGYCVQNATRYIFRGAALLAYPIASHFDILHSYSVASGERTNVLVENTSDRKWYERDYMRVAWGTGAVLSYESFVLAGATPGVKPTIYEGDNAPEGEQFERGVDHRYGEDVPQQWFTFTNRYMLDAPSIYFDNFGAVPICYFTLWFVGGVYDCVSEEVNVRTFFLEVPEFKATKDPERAYVPREMDDVEFEKFGYFRTERRTYDVQFGYGFHDAIRRAQRHRIWDRYVRKFEEQTLPSGAKRKVWTGDFDYSKMNPTPIVYYMNADHPRELVPASQRIADAWSKPFSEVVAFWKGGCGAKTDKAGYDKCIADNLPKHPMFILCENSDAQAAAAVAAKAPVADWSGTANGKKFCRNMDTPHLFGDLRYSTMHAVPDPIQIGLYGYGPSAADPLTGETISATAHSYVAQMKLGAERAVRTIEFHAGVADFNDIKEANEQQFSTKGKALKHYGQHGPKSTAAAQAYVKDMLSPNVRERIRGGNAIALRDDAGSWAQGRLAILHSNPTLDAQLVSGDEEHAVHALFRDPRIEKGAPSHVDPQQLQEMSIAKWNHIAGLRKREEVKMDLAAKGIELAEFMDPAVLGLAVEYGRAFDKAFCQAYVGAKVPTVFNWNAIAAATPAGEKGACATVGEYQTLTPKRGRVCAQLASGPTWAECSSATLMQQLRIAVNTANGGNSNAELYKYLPSPLYSDTGDQIVRNTQEIGRAIHQKMRAEVKADLWSRIYESTQLHEVGHTVGLRHNFEASTDALNFNKDYWALKLGKGLDVVNPWQRDTQAQALGNLRMKQSASVMDYTSKFNGRFEGLGHYDHAAIKFAYGDMVEVFNQPPSLTKSPGGGLAAMGAYLQEPSDDTPGETTLSHLGNQDMLRLTRKLHYSTLPKYFGGVEQMYDRRAVSWSSIKGETCSVDSDCTDGRLCLKMGSAKYCTDTKVTEVPYRFCSDEYNGRTPTCATFDEGADAVEIARNALDDYENYWFFYGYATDSVLYSPYRYSSTVAGYLYRAMRQFQYWAMNLQRYTKDDFWKKTYGIDYDLDPNGGLSGALATAEAFNTFAQILSRPSPAYYCYNSSRKRYEPYDDREAGAQSDCKAILEVDGARPLYPGWDFAGYDGRPVSGGQFYDRLTAFALLTDPTPPNYVGHTEGEDIRRYMVGFYNFFPKQVMNLMSGISVENADYFGWCVVNGGADAAGVKQADMVMRRHWVGGDQKACPDLCSSKPLEQQGQCRKYWLFPDGRPTFPSSRFRMPLLGGLYGMSMLTGAYDRSYMDLSRMYLAGHSSAVDVPSDVTLCTFTDPLSGKVYKAPQSGDPDLLSPGCLNFAEAQKVLSEFKDMKTLQDNYLFSEYQFRVSLIEVLRALHLTFEY